MGVVDPLLQRIVDDGRLDADRLHALALWLATRAADREPVKMAIALLGILQGYDSREVLLALGRHEELTLFVAVAVMGTEQDAEPLLWDLAKSVNGWGRIQVVERLADTTNPAIKRWMLTEGYRNSIMYEYLACTCAVAGELHVALEAGPADEELLAGAGEIIQALVQEGGPTGGIEDYEHGPQALESYLKHLPEEPRGLGQFLVLATIRQFLESREEAGGSETWPEPLVSRLSANLCTRLQHQAWREMTERGLESSDRRVLAEATEAAKHLEIDTWDRYYARLEAGGDDWHHVMQSDQESRIRRVVSLAESTLPLDEIATGPDTKRGLGKEFRHHAALDFVLQDLDRFPGLGLPLIHAGMQSPVVRNRHGAIRALSAWDRAAWPAETATHVEACLQAEPDHGVREAFEELLAGSTND
ncbi:MAG: hypothetical protein AAF533_20740 [Acidobacteriota bacterium]